MSGVLVAMPEPFASALAAELAARGVEVHGIRATPADDREIPALPPLDGVDVLVLHATRRALTADTVAAADRAGTRIVPVAGDGAGPRLAAAFGLGEPVPAGLSPAELAARVLSWRPAPGAGATTAPRVITVWGAHGAPGRTTVAIELAAELARGGAHTALVDADSHAPSVAASLGLPDEGPGLPAACRQVERGELDAAELTRISVPLGTPGRDVDVLVGVNRPSRWPELSAPRVAGALAACRDWAQVTVVDVAASLERDEEIVSDLTDGPRRNAATLAALGAADHIVAVVSADPVGVSRFLRAYPDLRATVGAVPVSVVVNRLRGAPVGLDARGQVRRALERYAGIREVRFLPDDGRGADAARRSARPVAEVAPRSALAAAMRRLAPELAGSVPASAPAPLAPAPVAAPSRRRRRTEAVP